jgi:hypothetical protein
MVSPSQGAGLISSIFRVKKSNQPVGRLVQTQI